ncbi:hypothetical protein EDF81_1552 [Enterobacter sp. BIGb0383]|uniref:E492 group microcin n=1 Tax=unclassified Enterobacter TaxID=2608935 RepID=UPI000F47665D|nr:MULTISPECIES: microcin [unclassified Enterobacter]ROP63031.1 hypothetical protein EDF81_1552 [Enterobacter sp. BIGb0383]ROS13192.1 hypothetical protein EC848_1554 [Enterobacter sp. BIGb0359]
MRELSQQDLVLAFGAGDANSQLISDMGNNAAWGAGLGAITGGGPGAAIGAVGGVVQTIGQGLIDHGPVSVPVPVMIGPSWNGSGGWSGAGFGSSSGGAGSAS